MGGKRADEDDDDEMVDPSVLSAVGAYSFSEYQEPQAGQPLICKRPIGFALGERFKPRVRVKAPYRRIIP